MSLRRSRLRFAGASINIGALALCSCSSEQAATPDAEVLGVEIVATHPFDRSSFTQGLEVDGDDLLVGTGQEGESKVYRTSLDGEMKESKDLDKSMFGEGITKTDNAIWQLTWLNGTAIKRDPQSLEEVGRAKYSGQGWGLCAFDDQLVMSDGTSVLRLLNKDSFAEQSRTPVTRDGAAVEKINELECVTEGDRKVVYSNIFQKTDILKIDLESGEVLSTIDASSLPNNAASDPNNVLNGIAHIPGTDRFYLTGKRWPDLYEVRFVEKKN